MAALAHQAGQSIGSPRAISRDSIFVVLTVVSWRYADQRASEAESATSIDYGTLWTLRKAEQIWGAVSDCKRSSITGGSDSSSS